MYYGLSSSVLLVWGFYGDMGGAEERVSECGSNFPPVPKKGDPGFLIILPKLGRMGRGAGDLKAVSSQIIKNEFKSNSTLNVYS